MGLFLFILLMYRLLHESVTIISAIKIHSKCMGVVNLIQFGLNPEISIYFCISYFRFFLQSKKVTKVVTKNKTMTVKCLSFYVMFDVIKQKSTYFKGF